MDPFGMSPEQYTAAATWVAALAAVATLVVVVLTARYAKGQLDEAQQLRLAQTRPFVVVSVEVEQRSMFMLAVQNVGKVPARNVRVSFDEMPHSSIRDLDDVRMFREPIPTMPPGHRYAAYWDTTFEVLSNDEPYEYPLAYRAEVTYEDLQGHEFGPEEYLLDLRVFEGQAAHAKGMQELVKVAEDIRDEHKKWTGSGLYVRAVDEAARDRRNLRPILLREALREKDKSGWWSALMHLVGHFRRRHGLYVRADARKRRR